MKTRARRTGLAVPIAFLLLATTVHASSTFVPDDFPTIQLAIDSGTDSVMVRVGNYPERPLLWRSLVLVGVPVNGVRPRVQGVIVQSQGDVNARVEHFALSGAVQLRTPGYGNDVVRFVACTLDSGLVQPDRFEFWDYALLEISESTIAGSISTIAVNHVRCVRDTFSTGGVFVAEGDGPKLTVEESRFHGGTTVAIGGAREGTLDARNNHIEGTYLVGIHSSVSDRATIVGNYVANCVETGISAYEGIAFGNQVESCGVGIRSSYSRVEGNQVKSCGSGIIAGAGVVVGNQVLGSTEVGLEAHPDPDIRVERNVVGRSGGDGIVVETGSFTAVDIVSNTSFRNQGHGFRVGPVWHDGVITRNIAYENEGYGMLADTTTATTSCNDWFGNAAGGARGMPSDGSDLAVDPRFCDVDSDTVSLFADSPLVNAPGCGLIGARGVGCDETAVLVERFEAGRVGDGVLVQWQFGGLDVPADAWVERGAAVMPEDWMSLGRGVEGAGGVWTIVDRDVVAGRAYRFRLAWNDGEAIVRSAAIEVDLDLVPLKFTLAPVVPNPTARAVRIRWSSPREEWVDLRVHDVAGREVARIARGLHSAGSHEAFWDGRISGAPAPSGIYFVRARGSAPPIVRSFLVRR